MLPAIAILVLAVYAWCLLRLLYGYAIWPSLKPEAPGESAEELPRVSVIIPARNEEANIGACLDTLLAQDYPADRMEVLVINDGSTDSTGAIARSFQAGHSNLTVIDKEGLAEGWTGKNHACWTGYQAAKGQYLCFLDADVSMKPGFLRSMLRFAVSRNLDALSPVPFQQTVSCWERLLMPGIYLMIACGLNFRKINDPACIDHAIAAGQVLLFSRQCYEKLGGHEKVRCYIVEDVAFFKILKREGFRTMFIFADRLVSVRMYRSVKELWGGFSKNMTLIMNTHRFHQALWATLRSLLIGLGPACVLVPALLLGDRTATWLAGAGLSLELVFVAVAGIVLKVPPQYLPGFPLASVMHAAMILTSWKRNKSGVRVWKGRSYPAVPRF